MLNDYEIIKEKVSIPFINEEGNLDYNNDQYKCFLENQNHKIISQEYECMLDLGNDHFAVCDIVEDIQYFTNPESAHDRYYDILHEEYEISNSKLKWGVIKINRDEKGNIIPKSETMIIPYLYDRISENNLKTATLYYNGKLTYLDLEEESENYGQQLVPCILEHAVPFGTEYDGFAQCSINGVTGYLPRNCRKMEVLKSDDLLTKNQMFYLSNYLSGDKSFCLCAPTIVKYFNLTFINLAETQTIDDPKKVINQVKKHRPVVPGYTPYKKILKQRKKKF